MLHICLSKDPDANDFPSGLNFVEYISPFCVIKWVSLIKGLLL